MAPGPQKPIQEKQAELNGSTRGQWALFASHREQIERLLVAALPPAPGRLCVLGAGNCNDLDLPWLTQVFREVHLVDIDRAALSRAVRRQDVEGSPKIDLHAPIELSGVGSLVEAWPPGGPASAADLEACARQAANGPAPDLGPDGRDFDVALSPCVLSQLMNPARDALRPGHGRDRILAALRARHLRLLAGLLRPGGSGILVTDLVSSDTFPPLQRAPHDRLGDVMRTVLDDQKCFRGLEPASMAADLATDRGLASKVTDILWAPPWLWHLSLQRAYLVYGVRFRRR